MAVTLKMSVVNEKITKSTLDAGQRHANVRRGRAGCFSHSSDFDRRGAFAGQINHAPLRREASWPVMDGWPRINADLCHRGTTIGGSSAFVDGKHDETETRVARELRVVLEEL